MLSLSKLIQDYNGSLEHQLDNKKSSLQLGATFNYAHLTKRELDILYYVLMGYTAKKIGCCLNISFRTVEVHINKLKIKLRCSSKGEIIAIAIRTGLFKLFFK